LRPDARDPKITSIIGPNSERSGLSTAKISRLIAAACAIASFTWQAIKTIAPALAWSCFTRLMLWRLKRKTLGTYAGIAIIDPGRARDSRSRFLSCTVEALQLIERLDPIRFGRVQRQLKSILCADPESSFIGSYDGKRGWCWVNFTKLNFVEYPNAMPCIYAAILVHEATHGAISNGEIPLVDVGHNSREYYCDAEASGFLKHVQPSVADIWMGKYQSPKTEGKKTATQAIVRCS
jgi:hypothetical protein